MSECYCESYYRFTCPNCRKSAESPLGEVPQLPPNATVYMDPCECCGTKGLCNCKNLGKDNPTPAAPGELPTIYDITPEVPRASTLFDSIVAEKTRRRQSLSLLVRQWPDFEASIRKELSPPPRQVSSREMMEMTSAAYEGIVTMLGEIGLISSNYPGEISRALDKIQEAFASLSPPPRQVDWDKVSELVRAQLELAASTTESAFAKEIRASAESTILAALKGAV